MTKGGSARGHRRELSRAPSFGVTPWSAVGAAAVASSYAIFSLFLRHLHPAVEQWNHPDDRPPPRRDRPHRSPGKLVAVDNNPVRFISPFGEPKWLPRWQAEASLEQDDRRWLRLRELEMVSDTQRAVGRPRIEND
jgi:hypothetical protein